MFVACSTLCFTRKPLEAALRQIADLEFGRVDLAIHESGPHMRPSQVAENLDAAVQRLRSGPGLTPSAFDLDFGPVDQETFRKRFEAICRLAKSMMVAVLTIPSAPLGSPFGDEVARLTDLVSHADRQGLVLSIETHGQTLTADPAVALALCKAVPGLGLTLDPSHYVGGPHRNANYDDLFPYVQDVHLRDTGKDPDAFQVRVGQGEIEYGRVVNLLERHGYDRGLTVAILDAPENPFEVELEVRKLKRLLETLV